MQKPNPTPKIVLPILGAIGLLVYVTAPLWLPSSIVDRLDYVALGLVVLIALPWLLNCFDELEFGGVKAKLRYENTTATAHESRELAEELAISRTSAEKEQQWMKQTQTPETGHSTDKDVTDFVRDLREMSRHYVKVRESMSSGAERTAKMTEIFGLLECLAKNIPEDNGDIVGWLSQQDAGYQLAAIAWLRSHPSRIKPAALIEAIDRSNQPFVQYWALRVLHGHVDRKGITDFSLRDRRTLQQLEYQVREGTDRWYQLHRINKKLSENLK